MLVYPPPRWPVVAKQDTRHGILIGPDEEEEMLGGSYCFLDLSALGRQEDWEEPKGRATNARGAVPDFSA